MTIATERAVLAGGCFWGMQDLLRSYPGVVSTRVGYSGGEVPNATYRDHGSHAEAIEITFDPARITLSRPSWNTSSRSMTRRTNRQGNDVGASYRSAIFYTTTSSGVSRKTPSPTWSASGLWPGKAVTEVVPVDAFWEAEPEHQDYLTAIRTAIPATSRDRTGGFPSARKSAAPDSLTYRRVPS